MGEDVGGRRPLGKPRVRWKYALLGYFIDLLQIRNWNAAKNGKVWKKTTGKFVTRKRDEAPKKSKQTK
jgi:hypothetical protein